MDRIKSVCAYLDKCTVFADVACDHGYFAQYMLDNGLCESAIISDISEKCLNKAKTLLSQYIKAGKCTSYVCDGLKSIGGADEVIIAGIGGEEIVKILNESYIPEKFVFQPMKNAEKLRKFLIESGCCLLKDDIFSDEKNFYYIIKGIKSGKKQEYTHKQFKYGRDSLKNPVLKEFLLIEAEKKKNYLEREMSPSNRCGIEKSISEIEETLDEIDRNI